MSDAQARAVFGRIYDETVKATLVYLTARCAQPADAADLLQEVYAEVFAALQKRGSSYIANPRAFVLRVARQKLSRHYTALERLRQLTALAQEDAGLPCQPPPEDWLDDRLVNKELLDRAAAFLKQKSPAVQKVFLLHYSLDQTIPEIAAALHMSQSNVKNMLYRTLAQLRRDLTEI